MKGREMSEVNLPVAVIFYYKTLCLKQPKKQMFDVLFMLVVVYD
jgi:hypothetical protein